MKLRKWTLPALFIIGTAMASTGYAISSGHLAASYGEPTLQPAPAQATPASNYGSPAKVVGSATQRAMSPARETLCTVTVINSTGAPMKVAGKTVNADASMNYLIKNCNLNSPTQRTNVNGIIVETVHNQSNKSITITYSGKLTSPTTYCGNCGAGLIRICNTEGHCGCVSCSK